MSQLLIGDRFFNAPEVLAVGNRAIGVWVRMACYHAQWRNYDIPRDIARQCGARKADLHVLVECGWLVPTADGWRLGLEGTGLWKLSTPTVSRPNIPAYIRNAVFERDGSLCLFCGSTENLSLDHILPWSMGGPDTVENLRVLCRSCNSRRGNRMEVDA